MQALATFMSKLIGAIVGVFIALGAVVTGHLAATLPSPMATSTITAATSTPLVATSTPAAPKKITLVATTSAATPQPPQTPSAPIPTRPTLSVETVNALARAAIVNVLCTTQNGGSFNPISGSGIIIDSRGIILTNAHVGEYLLLPQYVSCVIRTGSPAEPLYTAHLMYLPKAWIDANAQKLNQSSPTGTGENDYAFLLIDGMTNPNATLPSTFPALPMDIAAPQTGQQMVLAAYPAGFLGGISIALNLYTTSSVATVGQLYAFDTVKNIDLFSLGGTPVAQSGSSGGAVVDLYGNLRGVITTEIPGDTTSERDLRAITIGHIDRSLTAAGYGGLSAFLLQDAAKFADTFNKTIAPLETKALVDVINGQ